MSSELGTSQPPRHDVFEQAQPMIRQMNRSKRTCAATLALGAGLVLAAGLARPARAGVVVRLDNFQDRMLVSQAFRLQQPLALQVECVGAGRDRNVERGPVVARRLVGRWIVRAREARGERCGRADGEIAHSLQPRATQSQFGFAGQAQRRDRQPPDRGLFVGSGDRLETGERLGASDARNNGKAVGY